MRFIENTILFISNRATCTVLRILEPTIRQAGGDPIRTEDVDRALLVGFSRSLSAQPASSARLWCTW